MRISDWSSDVCSSDLSKNHWGARSVIERKPSPAPRRSLKSLEAGLALYPHFRRHISLSGPVTAAQAQAISEATGLKERQIRTLAARSGERRGGKEGFST